MDVTRIHRMLRILLLLRSERCFDIAGLSKEMGIARRTVFRDLRLLAAAGIPCRYDRRRRGYVLSESVFLPPLHLTLDESLALLLLTRRLIGDSAHPAPAAAASAAMKIEGALPRRVLAYCGDSLQAVEVRSRGRGRKTDGDCFERIRAAVAGRRRLQLHYHSAGERADITTVVEPYRLLFRFPGWYVIGRSSLHDEVRTFKLDRIIEMRVLDASFDVPAGFSLDKHFGKAWGMIPEGRVHQVELRFEAMVADNVEEVLWHPSQQTTRRPDGRLEFRVEVDGLTEISWWILGYGDQVEVIRPPELRERIRRTIDAMCERYRNGHAPRTD